MTRVGVVVSPGSRHEDVVRALHGVAVEAVPLWHAEPDLDDVDAVVLPAAHPAGAPLGAVLDEVLRAAEAGLPVLGIGSGFGSLCVAGALPGRLMPNASGRFLCRPQPVEVETRDTVWTCAFSDDQAVTFVHAAADGRYTADAEVLARLEGENQVVFRYRGSDPNGSHASIAGLTNARGTVVGVVPQPEYAVDALTGPSSDGRLVFESLRSFLAARG